MDLGGEVLVGQLRSTVADDEIAIGSLAERYLLSGLTQKFFWNVSNIDRRLREPEEHAGSITVPHILIPVTESVALPPNAGEASCLKPIVVIPTHPCFPSIGRAALSVRAG